jgi:hypothetical protein
MADTVKFTEDELKTLQENAAGYQAIQTRMGQISYNRMILEQQLDLLAEDQTSVEEQFKTAQQAERDFVKSLNDKYGPGTLNPETGEFTAAPATEAPAEPEVS